MNIYLDIDGVLLQKDGTLAEYFEEFLEFFVSKHDVFWLTTHCRGGENNTIRHITQYNEISERSLALLQKIKPTDWDALKTEGIDLSVDFVWFDDNLLEAEKKELLEQDVYFSFYQVNLAENPNQLKAITELDFINPR